MSLKPSQLKAIGKVSIKLDPDKRATIGGVFIEVGDEAEIPRGYSTGLFVVIQRGLDSRVRLLTRDGKPKKFSNKGAANKFLGN